MGEPKHILITFFICGFLNVSAFAEPDPNVPQEPNQTALRQRFPIEKFRTRRFQSPPKDETLKTSQGQVQVKIEVGEMKVGQSKWTEADKENAEIIQKAGTYKKQLGISNKLWDSSVQPLLLRILTMRQVLSSSASLTDEQIGRPTINYLLGYKTLKINNPRAELAPAFIALHKAVQDNNSEDNQICASLQEYLHERQKLNEELKAAVDELRKLLTVRQQVQLTIEGVL